jgi:hypothetical protein
MASVPHSVVHARSYVDEVEKKPSNGESKKSEPGVKGMVSSCRIKIHLPWEGGHFTILTRVRWFFTAL